MKLKACKKCRIFVHGSQCEICNGTNFSTNWKGKIIILDPEKSEIAQKIDNTKKGEYAIKVS